MSAITTNTTAIRAAIAALTERDTDTLIEHMRDAGFIVTVEEHPAQYCVHIVAPDGMETLSQYHEVKPVLKREAMYFLIDAVPAALDLLDSYTKESAA